MSDRGLSGEDPSCDRRQGETDRKQCKTFTGTSDIRDPDGHDGSVQQGAWSEYPPICEAAGMEKFSDKKTFSSAGCQEVLEAVKDKKYVIICGIEAHVCVLQTVIDLKEMGYQPVLVEDCISSRNLHDKEIALLRARDEGALLTTSESILFELTVTAEHEQFKQISKLVK